MFWFLLACLPPDPVFDDTGAVTDTLDPGDLVSTHGSEHCGEVVEDQVWADDGNPHVLTCVVTVGNGAELVIAPGTMVHAQPDSGLVIGDESAGGLRVLGSESQPVIFEAAAGSGARGTWRGLFLGGRADPSHLELHWLTVDGAGSSDGVHRQAALFVESPDLTVEQVRLVRSEGYGFALAAAGSFTPTSSGLHVTESALSAFAEVWATGTIPDGDLTGNDVDAIDLPGGQVTTSATWEARDVAYRLINDAYVDGTEESPAVLTLGEGTTLRFGDGRGLYIGTSGAAALVASGSAEAPVVFLGDRRQAGSWAGVGIRSHDTGSALTHFELGYGGTDFPLDGALHLEDAAASVHHGHVHDNAECGVWLEGGTSDVGPDMTWGDNAGGDLCQP